MSVDTGESLQKSQIFVDRLCDTIAAPASIGVSVHPSGGAKLECNWGEEAYDTEINPLRVARDAVMAMWRGDKSAASRKGIIGSVMSRLALGRDVITGEYRRVATERRDSAKHFHTGNKKYFKRNGEMRCDEATNFLRDSLLRDIRGLPAGYGNIEQAESDMTVLMSGIRDSMWRRAYQDDTTAPSGVKDEFYGRTDKLIDLMVGYRVKDMGKEAKRLSRANRVGAKSTVAKKKVTANTSSVAADKRDKMSLKSRILAGITALAFTVTGLGAASAGLDYYTNENGPMRELACTSVYHGNWTPVPGGKMVCVLGESQSPGKMQSPDVPPTTPSIPADSQTPASLPDVPPVPAPTPSPIPAETAPATLEIPDIPPPTTIDLPELENKLTPEERNAYMTNGDIAIEGFPRAFDNGDIFGKGDFTMNYINPYLPKFVFEAADGSKFEAYAAVPNFYVVVMHSTNASKNPNWTLPGNAVINQLLERDGEGNWKVKENSTISVGSWDYKPISVDSVVKESDGGAALQKKQDEGQPGQILFVMCDSESGDDGSGAANYMLILTQVVL
jgi:hypothetical protein